ncbi:MAG: hypothetical protein UW94_C0008G0041 [Parcubacteria group bacterium GW2011_GWA2_45_14]|nr:MAG: hypothetical protein UW94_C0008G0041 [Parcubacteria group bacterium GW2011_GWA2_45_14]
MYDGVMSLENPNFLKKKYDLHQSPEVESAADRTEAKAGEKLPQDPNTRIQNYLNRFKEITERTDPDKRERGIQALKTVLHDKFVIKDEEIPDSYFENQKRLAREQGHGDIEITDEMREQLTEVIIADQESTLDNWVDYLVSDDATYPDWLKYYAFRSVLNMGDYDKEQHQFTKRSKGTVKPFPDLNREALAYVLDAIEKKQKKEGVIYEGEDEAKFQKLLESENFSKLYAWAIEKVTPAQADQLTITKGQWVKYDQNSDHMPLVESLQGHGTGWCTAGESTAEAQLKGGDFYVYYSEDQDGIAKVPRAAIRMQEGSIAEVRGIAYEQNLDPYINDVVKDKLKEFPDGAQYEKKNQNMKLLTAIDNKAKQNQPLDKEDLTFLYELNQTIEGFGYQRDPRINELRQQRKPEDDMPVVFDCEPEQIAHASQEISSNTRAYVGQLQPGIFDKLQQFNIEHVFTSFPEGRLRRFNVEIGGQTKKQLEQNLKQANIKTSKPAQSMLDNKDFTTQANLEQLKLVRLTVDDLGLPNGSTTDQIYQRAEELGLDLCPAEVGPHLRLQYQDQPMNEHLNVGIKYVAVSGGVFKLDRYGEGLWLESAYWASPSSQWNPDSEFVFRLRQPSIPSDGGA